ncbi:SpoIIE family protein phosphatase [Streptomyces sp. NPDC058486]|uniref:ATP-binding SpoIIE family protein phosphatase n=1 Tax=unclassified Streptomyces TaxID=2593676 RepID=UPI00365E05AC
MSPSDRDTPPSGGLEDMAALLLDAHDHIRWWSRSAEELLGRTAEDIEGRPAHEVLGTAVPSWTDPRKAAGSAAGSPSTSGSATESPGTAGQADASPGASGSATPASGTAASAAGSASPSARTAASAGTVHRLLLRHATDGSAEADVVLLPGAVAGERMLLVRRPVTAGRHDPDRVLARSLLNQRRLGVAEFAPDLTMTRSNAALEALRPAGAPAGADWLYDLTDADGDRTVREILHQVAVTGMPVVGADFRPAPEGSDPVLSLACFPVDAEDGARHGVALVATEPAARLRAHHRLTDAYRRAFEIGESLDVVRAARDLVDLLVPALGDLACVDFPDDVLQGRDPVLGYPGHEASRPRRVAVKAADGTWPSGLVQQGEPVPPAPPGTADAAVAVGGVIKADAATARAMLGDEPGLFARLMPEDMHSALGCPLYHRSRLFGYVMVWRTRTPEPFGDAETRLLQDLCDRTAMALDNAHRYTREHRTALVLQRSLLPPAVTESQAAETSGIYLPASGTLSVGGDWFDALPLSSMRIGLVVGDVIGHGLQATATMARLRTAVQTLADLDLPPDELLTHLDDLVQRMQAESEQPDAVGASCLFAVYDPVTRVCHMASAGHPAPALLLPDGGAEFVPVVPGPPLGVGDNPFEITDVTLPPGSVLALYTDGLVDYDHDITRGGEELLRNLRRFRGPERSLEAMGRDLMGCHPHQERPADDVTLLLARTRAVADTDTAHWEYPVDPAAVHDARHDVNAQLRAWGLDDLMFSTELIVSELVTNAMRYAGGPVGLRLIRGRVLVCEVSDPSNTQPRLRRALITDEGGRGLFLIAQLASRWGCRYGARGKTIWAEQLVPTP